ncbi:MAG: outer membrane beta-barrel protein [Hyphomicrobiales bacterium]
MKKFILLFIVVLFSASYSVAQTEKGKIYAYSGSNATILFENMDVEYGAHKGMDPKKFHLNILPAVGYFFVDNLAIGLGLDFNYKHIKITETVIAEDITYKPESRTGFAFAPFAKYYFLEDKMKPYVIGEFNYGWGWSKKESLLLNEVIKDDLNDNVIGFGFGAGIAYFVSDCVALDLGFIYKHDKITYKIKDKPGYYEDLSNINSAFRIRLGFSIHL